MARSGCADDVQEHNLSFPVVLTDDVELSSGTMMVESRGDTSTAVGIGDSLSRNNFAIFD